MRLVVYALIYSTNVQMLSDYWDAWYRPHFPQTRQHRS